MTFTPANGTVATPDRVLDKAALYANVRRAAAGFRSLGLGPGGAVAMMLRNDIPFVECTLAANWIGAFIVPVNWYLRGEEVRAILIDSGAGALVIHTDLLAEVRPFLPENVRILAVEPSPSLIEAYRIADQAAQAPDDLDRWEDWLGGFEPVGDPPMGRFTMIYTSGTTAQPKGVTRASTGPEAIERGNAMMAEAFGLWSGMNAVMTGPMYHSATFAYSFGCLALDSDIFLMPRFDAAELLRLIEQRRAEAMHMVPTMFSRLLRLPPEVQQRYELSSLKYIIHGAAPCPPNVKRAMIEWWGPVIHEYYGSTEAAIVSVASSEEWLARPGTVGRPRETTPVQVRDAEGAILPPGQEGELYMRLNAAFGFTYRNRPEMDEGTCGGAWFTNGDVGYMDEDGYLYLCDRRKDMIISGGVNIYPSEIEGVIGDHPAVRDCAVFGIPDEDFGEAVAAAVELSGEASGDAIRAHVAGRLAGYKVPRVVTFHAALPREDSGKIFKRRLRDPYWAGKNRMI